MGAAQVAAANLFSEKCRKFSHPALAQFFNDPVKEIRDEAAGAFRQAEGRQLESCRELIRIFMESKAFMENADDLTWAAERSTADIAEDIVTICESMLRLLNKEMTDPQSRMFVQTETVAELLLRAYRQTTDERFRSRCLDLVDRLLSVQAYGISKELEAFER